VEAAREHAWAAENAAENAAALRELRRYLPTDVATLTVEQFEAKVAGRGVAENTGRRYFYPPALVDRLKGRRLLHWVVTHREDIARANFLMGPHKTSFDVLNEYDLPELRAVYAVLPIVRSFQPRPTPHARSLCRRALVKSNGHAGPTESAPGRLHQLGLLLGLFLAQFDHYCCLLSFRARHLVAGRFGECRWRCRWRRSARSGR
jgi:hypothetical protein